MGIGRKNWLFAGADGHRDGQSSRIGCGINGLVTVKQTLDMLDIPRTKSVWNRTPDARRDGLVEFALEHEALTTRELAVKYRDEKRYFISEPLAYPVPERGILKAADLITVPDYVVIKAAEEFKDKTTAINEMLLSGM